MAKKHEKMKGQKESIPLFPWNWIAKEIDYQKNMVYFIDKIGRTSIKARQEEGLVEVELPQDNSKESIGILKRLGYRGIDPNYIDIILWYHSDASKRFDCSTVSQTYLKKTSEAVKMLTEIPKRIKGVIDPTLFGGFKEVVAKIQEKCKFTHDKNLLSSTLFIPKKGLRPSKGGRPPDEYMDLIILLVYRHLKKNLKRKAGHKGPYTITAELLNACFPVTFARNPLNRESTEERLRRLKASKDYLKHCKAFEKKFEGLGFRFVNKARRMGVLDVVYEVWMGRGVKKIYPRLGDRLPGIVH